VVVVIVVSTYDYKITFQCGYLFRVSNLLNRPLSTEAVLKFDPMRIADVTKVTETSVRCNDNRGLSYRIPQTVCALRRESHVYLVHCEHCVFVLFVDTFCKHLKTFSFAV